MESLSEKQRREVILKFYDNHLELGKGFTIKHFQTMGMHHQTIYRILKRFGEKGAERKPGSGGTNKKMTQTEVKSSSDQSIIVQESRKANWHTNMVFIKAQSLAHLRDQG